MRHPETRGDTPPTPPPAPIRMVVPLGFDGEDAVRREMRRLLAEGWAVQVRGAPLTPVWAAIVVIAPFHPDSPPPDEGLYPHERVVYPRVEVQP